MSGMYKQLDAWIKAVLPVLPDSKLQDNLLHVLQVILVLIYTKLQDYYSYCVELKDSDTLSKDGLSFFYNLVMHVQDLSWFYLK